MIGILNDLSFRLALLTAKVPEDEWLDTSLYKGYSDTQMVNATQHLLQLTFESRYGYLAGALAVILVAVFSVVPLFYGWWELGRNVLLSPIEIAKASNAPLLLQVHSNRDINAMLEDVGDWRVHYGEDMVSGETRFSFSTDGKARKRIPRRLEMDDPKWVLQPSAGERYE